MMTMSDPTACPIKCSTTGNYYWNTCDDGGAGSEYSYAPYGQDCGDCGPRLDLNVAACTLDTPVGAMCNAATGVP